MKGLIMKNICYVPFYMIFKKITKYTFHARFSFDLFSIDSWNKFLFYSTGSYETIIELAWRPMNEFWWCIQLADKTLRTY
jgi:hypothetical protein